MKILWLTNTDPNVAEDMLLLGLASQDHEVEVRPWKASFSWIADPSVHGGNYLSCCLSTFPRITVSKPDVIVVTRGWRYQEIVDHALGQYHAPCVYLDTEDKLHEPPDWLRERISAYFAVQTPKDRKDIISLPYAYRADLVQHRTGGIRPIKVSWGGTLQLGHGGRWELLGKPISLGLVQATLSACPAEIWYAMCSGSMSSISIGGAQNEVAGVNARHFEIAALGANVLSYRHGIQLDSEIPEGIEFFSTADELIELCKKERAPLSAEMVKWNLRFNSHLARAEQFVQHLRNQGIV